MRAEADQSGSYVDDFTGSTYPRIQLVSAVELRAGKRPKMPTAILPYVQAKPRALDQLTFDHS